MTVSRETPSAQPGTVSRETVPAEPRLSVRVDPALKDTIRETTHKLQRRGLRTSASELIVLLVTRGLRDLPVDQLEHEIIQMRQEQAS
jgi:hypothetical protein